MIRYTCLLLSLAAIPALANENGPATETWEYLVIKDINLLNKSMQDPTHGCKETPTLTVLGNLGWEVVQIFSDSRQELSSATGTIQLGPPNTRGQAGTFQLKSESRETMRVLLKRRQPHVMAKAKSC